MTGTVELFTTYTKLAEMTLLASKDLTTAKKLPPMGLMPSKIFFMKKIWPSYRLVLGQWIHNLHVNLNPKQECIPVGCIPPAAVAVPGGSPPGTPPDQAHPPGTRSPGSRHPLRSRHLPVDRITDACENITLPQLCCGR